MDTIILLIRHGISEVSDYLAGRKDGIHLSHQGKLQADQLAERISTIHIDKIYSSPIIRTIETAKRIAEKKNLEIQICNDITEIEYGEWTGKTFNELKKDNHWERFHTFRSGTRPPAGENMIEVQKRMTAHIEKVLDIHNGSTVALVSHGDPIRAALCFYTGIPLDLMFRIKINTASVSVLKINQWGSELLCLNHRGCLPELE